MNSMCGSQKKKMEIEQALHFILYEYIFLLYKTSLFFSTNLFRFYYFHLFVAGNQFFILLLETISYPFVWEHFSLNKYSVLRYECVKNKIIQRDFFLLIIYLSL